MKNWLKDFFSPETFNAMDTVSIGESLNDATTRIIWLNNCFEEIKRINLEVDKRLLSDSMYGITDLCARRKAYQDVLESILSARRQAGQQTRHNPTVETVVNLDRMTA